jgi:hypothetical protein
MKNPEFSLLPALMFIPQAETGFKFVKPHFFISI